MSYSKVNFADGLFVELHKGFDVVRISNWAMGQYLAHSNELESGLQEEIMKIVAMQEGREFEFNEDELRQLIASIKGESKES